jgi:hypothetical protein
MRHRLLASLVALLVLVSTSLATVCAIACAAKDAAPAPQAHSCHAETSEQSPGAPALSAGVHVCGHPDGLPDLARTLDLVVIAARSVTDVLTVPPVQAASRPLRHRTTSPDRHALHTPLRI